MCEQVMTGKPNPLVIDIIMKQHHIPKSHLNKFVMLGDNPTTDIMFANNAGIDSVLVLTGVTPNESEAKQWCTRNDSLMPTYIMNSFGAKF